MRGLTSCGSAICSVVGCAASTRASAPVSIEAKGVLSGATCATRIGSGVVRKKYRIERGRRQHPHIGKAGEVGGIGGPEMDHGLAMS
jgi:hypothetical protein